jgi:LacI family transcriptional regulator
MAEKNRKKKVTLDDIARIAGVSKSTVSRLVADPGSVKGSTREAVFRAMAETNYSSTGLDAARLRNPALFRTVALIAPDIRNPFWGNFSYLIQSQLFRRGYNLQVYNTGFDPEKETQCVRQILSSYVAGVIANSNLVEDEEVERLYGELDCPVMFLNRMLRQRQFGAVIQDNFQAGYLATKHLAERGYRRFVFLAGPMNSPAVRQRLEGFRAALENSYIPVEPEMIRHGEMSVARGAQEAAFVSELARKEPVAVVAVNDETAIGLIAGCHAAGVKIPEKAGVVGFDNIAPSSLPGVELTTVQQPIEEISKVVVEIILGMINEGTGQKKHVVLQPQLIVRKSSGGPGKR